MKETDSKYHSSPFIKRLNLLKEIRIDFCIKCSVKTSLNTFWRLGSDLNCRLKQRKREGIDRLAGNKQSKVLMHLSFLWIKDLLNFSHELKTQVAVLQDDPCTSIKSNIDLALG